MAAINEANKSSTEELDWSVAAATVNVDTAGMMKSADSDVTRPSTGDLDLNMIGSAGFNCLHAACDSDNSEIIEYLLTKRLVDPNIPGKD